MSGSEIKTALVEATERGITPFELRLDQEAFQRGVEYALKHKDETEVSDLVPGTPSVREPSSRYFRSPFGNIFRVYRSGIVARWDSNRQVWDRYSNNTSSSQIQHYTEI